MTPERWRALSPYLDQALESSEYELSTWLESVRAEDAALAADLEGLLEQRDVLRREGFLAAGPALSTQESWVGRTLGAYTVIAPLGQGGMGSVWRARRSDGWHAGQAAVKVLHASVLALVGAERFKREGSILGRLKHPHIAHLLDAGVSRTGQPYLVLEHVEGQPIDAHCDSRALGVESRVRLVLDVLEAVAHAHANLIVHRDIKPSNVLVTREGEVKLLDFGIAKLLEEAEPTASPLALTCEGARVLTPECAAPEQLTGAPITTATDVYAVGVLLYLLLSGCHPAGAALGSSSALIKAIVETDPPRLSGPPRLAEGGEGAADLAARRGTTPDRLRRALRGDLETIVAKALKKDPQERYGSAAALAEDLRKYLNREPIAARPDTLRYRARRFLQRHRLSAALAGLALLAFASGLTGTIWQARAATRERDFALTQLARAENVVEFTEFLMGQMPEGRPVSMHDILSRAETLVDKRFGYDDALAVDLLTTIGGIYQIRQENDNARRVLKHAYDVSQRVSDPAVRANAVCDWGLVVASDGDVAAGRRLIDDALATTSDERRFDNVVAFCSLTKANLAMDEGTPDEVVALSQTALARLQRSPAGVPEMRVTALQYLALASSMRGDTTGADRLFAQALEQLERIGRQDTSDAAGLLHNWAMNIALTNTLEALDRHRRVVAIFEGEEPDSVPMPIRLNYGVELNRLARYAEARTEHQAVEAQARKHGDPPLLGLSASGVARACRGLGDLPGARAALDEAATALRSVPAEQRPWADLAREEGLLAAAEGRPEEARRRLGDALLIHEKVAEKHVSHVETLLELALLELHAGDAGEAEKHTRAALALAEKLRGQTPHSAWVGLSQLALGEVYESRHDTMGARALFREAVDHMTPTLGSDHPAVREARKRLSPLR